MPKLPLKAYLLLEVNFFSPIYSCIDTIFEYIHVIFVILFYVQPPKMIMSEKACPWDKNSHFSFPDIKMQHFNKKMYFLGLILVDRLISGKKYNDMFRIFRNKLEFGKTCPWDI